MEKEGLNIWEFQIKLFQKMEELTLYSNEQNKMIKQIEDKNYDLQNQILKVNDLEKRSKKLRPFLKI